MPDRSKPLLIVLLVASLLALQTDSALAAPEDASASGRARIAGSRAVAHHSASLEAVLSWFERVIALFQESQTDPPQRSATVDPWGLDPESTPPLPPNPGAAATGD